MPDSSSQTFLRELDRSRAARDRLPKAARRESAGVLFNRWSAADRLRANLDAAVYSRAERDSLPDRAARRVDAEASSNHAVLGLIFLKYVSDSFAIRQEEIEKQLRDPQSDHFLDPADYESAALYAEAIRQELEERDYYIEKNVFWVPAPARKVERKNDEGRKRSQGTNKALCTADHSPFRKSAEKHGSSDSWQTTAPIRNVGRGELTRGASRKKQTGIHCEMRRLAARTGRERLLDGTARRERNRSRRQAAATAERGRRADSNFRDDHQTCPQSQLNLHHSSFCLQTFPPPDLRADYVMANPPFNISEWWDAKLEGDPRWGLQYTSQRTLHRLEEQEPRDFLQVQNKSIVI